MLHLDKVVISCCILCGMLAVYYMSLYVVISVLVAVLLYAYYETQVNCERIHVRGLARPNPLRKFLSNLRLQADSVLHSVMKNYWKLKSESNRTNANGMNGIYVCKEKNKSNSINISQRGYSNTSNHFTSLDRYCNESNERGRTLSPYSSDSLLGGKRSLSKNDRSPRRYSRDMSFSPKGSPWGTSVSPKLRSHGVGVKTVQTVAGPLLASTRYNININSGLYGDVNSPGFSSRVARYATDNSTSVTHQKQYSGPGQFPLVQLNRSTSKLPVVSTRRSPGIIHSTVMVRVAPPESRLLNKSQILSNGSSLQEQDSTKSVLEVLKEISRKRIHSQLDDDIEDDIVKRQRKGEGLNSMEHRSEEKLETDPLNIGKRGREESPSHDDSSPRLHQQVSKRTRNNEIHSSLSSSRNLLKHMKRKSSAADWSRSSSPVIGKQLKHSRDMLREATSLLIKTSTTPVTTTTITTTINTSTNKDESTEYAEVVKPSEFLPKFAAVLDKNSTPVLNSVAALEAKRAYDTRTRLRSMLAIIAGSDDFMKKPEPSPVTTTTSGFALPTSISVPRIPVTLSLATFGQSKPSDSETQSNSVSQSSSSGGFSSSDADTVVHVSKPSTSESTKSLISFGTTSPTAPVMSSASGFTNGANANSLVTTTSEFTFGGTLSTPNTSSGFTLGSTSATTSPGFTPATTSSEMMRESSSMPATTPSGFTPGGSSSTPATAVSGFTPGGSLSTPATVVSGFIPGGSLSTPATAVSGFTPGGSLSTPATVVSGFIPGGSLSTPATAVSGFTPGGSLSTPATVVSGFIPGGSLSTSATAVSGFTPGGSLSTPATSVSGFTPGGSLSMPATAVSGFTPGGSLSTPATAVSGFTPGGSLSTPATAVSGFTLGGSLSTPATAVSGFTPGGSLSTPATAVSGFTLGGSLSMPATAVSGFTHGGSLSMPATTSSGFMLGGNFNSPSTSSSAASISSTTPFGLFTTAKFGSEKATTATASGMFSSTKPHEKEVAPSFGSSNNNTATTLVTVFGMSNNKGTNVGSPAPASQFGTPKTNEKEATSASTNAIFGATSNLTTTSVGLFSEKAVTSTSSTPVSKESSSMAPDGLFGTQKSNGKDDTNMFSTSGIFGMSKANDKEAVSSSGNIFVTAKNNEKVATSSTPIGKDATTASSYIVVSKPDSTSSSGLSFKETTILPGTFSFGTKTLPGAANPFQLAVPVSQSGGFKFELGSSKNGKENTVQPAISQPLNTPATTSQPAAPFQFKPAFSFGSTATSNGPTQNAGFAFGGAQKQQQDLFSFGSNVVTTAQNSTPNTFNFSAAKPGGFSFSSKETTSSTTTQPLFGASETKQGEAQTSGGLFGSSSSPSSSVFSGPSTSTPFGSSTTAGGLFGSGGNVPAQSSGTFGGGLFSTPITQANSTFGNPSTPAFGSAATPASQNSGPVFGSPSQAFGSALQSSSTFGSGQQSSSLFGTNGAAPSTFSFGTSASAPVVQQPAASLFGSGATPFQFGSAATPATGGFNFGTSGVSTSTPAINFGAGTSANPAFQFGAGGSSSPLFGGQTTGPSMFSIGSGSTAPRARTSRMRRQR